MLVKTMHIFKILYHISSFYILKKKNKSIQGIHDIEQTFKGFKTLSNIVKEAFVYNLHLLCGFLHGLYINSSNELSSKLLSPLYVLFMYSHLA